MNWFLAVLVLAGTSAKAQLRTEIENNNIRGFREVSDISSVQKSGLRSLTTREYHQLIQNTIVEPQPEPGAFGVGFVYQGGGEWKICDRAPEPSSLLLLLVGGAMALVGRKK